VRIMAQLLRLIEDWQEWKELSFIIKDQTKIKMKRLILIMF